MNFRRAGTALALIGAMLVASAAPALAHAELTGSDPKQGGSLATAPSTVQLTFSEPVTPVDDGISVTGPDGAKWTVGKATAVDKTVSAPVTATGPAGAYTLLWKVKADDGDIQSGKIGFTLTAAVAPSTTAAPTSSSAASATASSAAPATATSSVAPAADSGGGMPTWVWILIVVVIVAAAVALLAKLRRPGKDQS